VTGVFAVTTLGIGIKLDVMLNQFILPIHDKVCYITSNDA
jgi:hypothetical protein